MLREEKQFIQHVDDFVLHSDIKQLEYLQRLDRETQLHGISFYDIILNSHKAKIPSNHKKNQSK